MFEYVEETLQKKFHLVTIPISQKIFTLLTIGTCLKAYQKTINSWKILFCHLLLSHMSTSQRMKTHPRKKKAFYFAVPVWVESVDNTGNPQDYDNTGSLFPSQAM